MKLNPKMDMQKVVTLDGFGVRVDPRDHFGKNATLTKSQHSSKILTIQQGITRGFLGQTARVMH